jgi:hypothetical protein
MDTRSLTICLTPATCRNSMTRNDRVQRVADALLRRVPKERAEL